MSTVGSVGDEVSRLLRVLGALRIPLDYERSIKISHERIFANRFLLSGRKCDFGASPAKRVLQMCGELGMPHEHLSTIGFHLPSTENIHTGFEQDTHGCIYKVYLEFTKGIGLTIKPDGRSEPVLMYLAYKWTVTPKSPGAVTRYLWYPMNRVDQLLGMVSEIDQCRPGDVAYELTRELLGFATSNMPIENIQYLEVREDASGRRSFDLNFYDAGLKVRDIHPVLLKICRHQGVRPSRFQDWYDQVKGLRVGHLSCGTNRDGILFFSVYYGACLGDGYAQALRDMSEEWGMA